MQRQGRVDAHRGPQQSMMGANGILGAGAPLVCGAALAAKFRAKGEVAISFVGDGGANQGTFLESLNLAACGNCRPSSWWKTTATRSRPRGNTQPRSTVTSAGPRASGCRVLRSMGPTSSLSTKRPASSSSALGQVVGPPCSNARWSGSSDISRAMPRPIAGRVSWDDIRANRDCLKKFAKQVTSAGLLSVDALTAIDREVRELIDEAVTQAKNAPLPALADLTTDVYVRY